MAHKDMASLAGEEKDESKRRNPSSISAGIGLARKFPPFFPLERFFVSSTMPLTFLFGGSCFSTTLRVCTFAACIKLHTYTFSLHSFSSVFIFSLPFSLSLPLSILPCFILFTFPCTTRTILFPAPSPVY